MKFPPPQERSEMPPCSPAFTSHARVRMQQRGIPFQILDTLLEYGRETHDHRGCRIVRFDKRSRARRFALRQVKARLHQPMFRAAVIAAYGGRCALSGLPASLLDAGGPFEGLVAVLAPGMEGIARRLPAAANSPFVSDI